MSGAIQFGWDHAKSQSNLRKHRVSFAEAETAFNDEHGLLLDDPDHSIDEDRYVFLGVSIEMRLLVVVHCYREGDSVIRIISARRATPAERAVYRKRWLR